MKENQDSIEQLFFFPLKFDQSIPWIVSPLPLSVFQTLVFMQLKGTPSVLLILVEVEQMQIWAGELCTIIFMHL